MSKNNQYVAIIGDLVDSRNLNNRSDVQEQFKSVMDSLNDIFADHLYSKFVVTLGDEFQGLVKRTLNPFQFYHTYYSLFGIQFETRLTFGLGNLSTDLKETAIGMDGSCFHQARKSLERMKKKNKLLEFSGFEMDVAINALANIVSFTQSQWTPRQFEVVFFYMKYLDQVKVGKELNISKQAVSKILSAANINVYYQGWNGIKQLFAFVKYQIQENEQVNPI